MQKSLMIAALAGLGLTAAAQATIAMSFADPIPGRQLHNEADSFGPGIGLLSYDMTAPITFLFDGSEEGLPNHVFVNVHMEMHFSIGAATTIGGVTVAPVAGFFRIIDASTENPTDIMTGVASEGTYVRISNSSSLLFSDPNFSFVPGPALLALTGPLALINPTEAVFTLTSVIAVGGGNFMNSDGTFRSFDANASFTGNSEVIPTPGALALGGFGTLLLARRRRGGA